MHKLELTDDETLTIARVLGAALASKSSQDLTAHDREIVAAVEDELIGLALGKVRLDAGLDADA